MLRRRFGQEHAIHGNPAATGEKKGPSPLVGGADILGEGEQSRSHMASAGTS